MRKSARGWLTVIEPPFASVLGHTLVQGTFCPLSFCSNYKKASDYFYPLKGTKRYLSIIWWPYLLVYKDVLMALRLKEMLLV